MSEPRQGGGGFGRDAGTQTGRAVMLIAVAVVVAVLLLRHAPASTSGAAAATTAPAATTTVPHGTTTTPTTQALISPSQITLQVLNGASPTQPLAGKFSTQLKASPGYRTLAPNNATAQVPASLIYVVTAGYGPEADALAKTLGLSTSAVQSSIPTGAPVPTADRTTANLVLVIGPDLASQS